jgi:hypothetical protein
MADEGSRPCKAALVVAILAGGFIGIPMTGGLILLVPIIWGILVYFRRKNERAYRARKQREWVEADAAYGRRMRGY